MFRLVGPCERFEITKKKNNVNNILMIKQKMFFKNKKIKKSKSYFEQVYVGKLWKR